MANSTGEAAIPHLPYYMTPPGETDTLFVVVIIFVVLMVLALGTFYFHMHALPEKMAHGAGKTQFQLVAILALLALFTHNNLFWILALLLATIEFPDVGSTLYSMERSLKKLADRTLPLQTGAPDEVEPPMVDATATPDGSSTSTEQKG